MGVGLFVFGIGFSPDTIADYRATMMHLYDQARRPATVGLGGLVGAIGWCLTGHQGGHFLFHRLPLVWKRQAETPWRERVLSGGLPLFKPLLLGAVFLIGGAAAAEWLTSVSGQAISTGVWSGAALGAVWSAYSLSSNTRKTVSEPPV